MVNLFQVEQSFDQPSDYNSDALKTAIEKSEGAVCMLRFCHRGGLIGDGTLRR